MRHKAVYWEERQADHGTKFLNVARIIQEDGPLKDGSIHAALAMADGLNDLVLARRYGERTE